MKRTVLFTIVNCLLCMHAMAQSFGVESFALVDWRTDQDIRTMSDPDTTFGGFYDYNIRANTYGHVGSVKFEYYRVLTDSSWTRIENEAPYSLGGDINGDYESWFTLPGDYILTATPYSGKNGGGEQGTPLSIKMVVLYNPYPPVIESFTLVDPITDMDIRQLHDNDTIYSGVPINIRINTDHDYGTIKIQFGDNYFLNEIWPPFAVGGNEGDNYFNWFPEEGVHVLTATPFSERYGVDGIMGTPVSITLTVLPPPAVGEVTSFTLVDWNSDLDIRDLSTYDTLTSAEANSAIRANVSGAVGSVRFTYHKVSGTSFTRFENEPPFVIGGDINGDYEAWGLTPGDYLITATPYSGDNGTGIQGSTVSAYIHVPSSAARKGSAGASVNAVIYPNPVSDIVTISDTSIESGKIEVKDITGSVLITGYIGSQGSQSIDLSSLPPGIYYITIESGEGMESYKVVKK